MLIFNFLRTGFDFILTFWPGWKGWLLYNLWTKFIGDISSAVIPFFPLESLIIFLKGPFLSVRNLCFIFLRNLHWLIFLVDISQKFIQFFTLRILTQSVYLHFNWVLNFPWFIFLQLRKAYFLLNYCILFLRFFTDLGLFSFSCFLAPIC